MTNGKRTKPEAKLVIFLVMVFIIITSSILTFSLSVFIMQFILASITIPMLIKKDYRLAKLYLIIFVISILFVFLVYLANQMNYGSPYYIGGSDDLMFEQQGLDVHNAKLYNPSRLLESDIIPRWHNSSFFVIYIAILIKFSNIFDGYTTFLPLIINVYFLIWATMLFEYFIKKYANFSDLKANISIAVFALTPNIQYINSHVFRDTLNLLQILLIVYFIDKLLSNKHYIRKILFVALLAFLIFTTYYTRANAIVFAGALCLFIFGEKLNLKKRYLIIPTIPILMISNFHEFIRLEGFISGYSNYVLTQSGDGLSAYVFGQALLPFGVVLRALYAFITPFPNFFGLFKDPSSILYDFTMLLIYIGVLVQVLAVPFIIKRVLKLDWLAICFLTWFLAIIATTFTFRHIILYYPFMVAVAVDGYMTTSKKTRTQILFFSVCFLLSLAMVYLSLKLFG